MIITSTQIDIEEHLKEVGLKKGMDVVVHSGLMAFGHIEDAAQTVWNALTNVLGDKSTIVAPTYSFGTNDTDNPYDRILTPSTNVGVLGEFMRSLPDAHRSASPIHSHVAIGPKADLMMASSATSSMGTDTDFDIMYQNKFHCLLLGCSLQHGCTYLHHMEAMLKVPYRKWIGIRIKTQENKQNEQFIKCKYFARDDDGYKADFAKLIPDLEAAGIISKAKAPYGQSHLMTLPDLHNKVEELLTKDPYSLVSPIDS